MPLRVERWVLAHLLCVGASLVASLVADGRHIFPAVDDDHRMAWLQNAVKQSVHMLEINQCGSETKHSCGGRDFSNGALAVYLLSGGVNTSGAMYYLKKVRPDGSFVGQAYCALLHEPQFVDSLNTDDRAWFIDTINEALPSLSEWKGADVSYSNMYFMGMVNSILCGEGNITGINATLGHSAAKNGYSLLSDWKSFAAQAGNHEFNSPTYYWVQINAIQLGCMYSTTAAKEDLCQILDHIWANVAANYFYPTEAMSGPHSRDYDFLFGHGALQVHTYINGLGTHPPVCETDDAHCERTTDGQNALVYLNALRVRDGSGIGHRVPELILQLSLISPVRIVESKWLGQMKDANNQSDRFGDRYNYIVAGRYSIGSASSDYITNTHVAYYPHPQDKLVDIEFALPNMSQLLPIPSITIVPGWRDQPYGHFYEPLTQKPSHLASHPGNVQFQNLLLQTNALNPTEQLDGFNQTVFSNLATNIILPLHNVSLLLIDGKPVKYPTTSTFSMDLAVDNTLTFQVMQTCATIRILHLDGVGGVLPALELKGDRFGMPLGAIRIAGYHYRGTNRTLSSSTHVKSAFLFLVDVCEKPEEVYDQNKEVRRAAVTLETTEAYEWIVSARIREKTLEVVRDISEPHCERWSCLINRTIDGKIIVRKTLQVNGKLIGRLPEP